MVQRFSVGFLPQAVEFLEGLEGKTREKVYFNIRKAQVLNDPALFRKLNEHIWEFRTYYNRKYIRLFAFWENAEPAETLVLATHGLIKKTGKTPVADIERAERIRKEYLSQKRK